MLLYLVSTPDLEKDCIVQFWFTCLLHEVSWLYFVYYIASQGKPYFECVIFFSQAIWSTNNVTFHWAIWCWNHHCRLTKASPYGASHNVFNEHKHVSLNHKSGWYIAHSEACREFICLIIICMYSIVFVDAFNNLSYQYTMIFIIVVSLCATFLACIHAFVGS